MNYRVKSNIFRANILKLR